MFGFYELRLPGFLHQRLRRSAAAACRAGAIVSVAAMGVLSAVIVSPCVAAPLAGALLYISQTRDVLLGGAALFAMALGMGVPLIVVGVSEGALLPQRRPVDGRACAASSACCCSRSRCGSFPRCCRPPW